MSVNGKGWRPQMPDHRDFLFHLQEPVLQDHELAVTGGIPRDETPAVWNQQQEGSCTAHGALGIFVTEAIRQGISLPAAPVDGAPLSRQAHYYWTREAEGTQDSDSGAAVRDSIKTLVAIGAAPEKDWPYDPAKIFDAPPPLVLDEAKQHMAIKYQSIVIGVGGAPMRTALSRGLGIAFGFPVPVSFEDGTWDASSGRPLPLPGIREGFIGGHCVWVRGWDFSQRFSSGPSGSYRTPTFFVCRNSWSESFGMDGEFNIAADWFTPWRGLASDLWALQAVK